MDQTNSALSEPSTIRLVLADDDELLRDSLAYLIESQPDLAVVGRASNGEEAVEQVGRLAPDVVLMDIRMPVLDGIAATRQIKLSDQSVRVLVLTTFDNDEYVFQAFQYGADGFLLKRVRADDLHRAIRTVAQGDALVDPEVTRALINSCIKDHRPSLDLYQHFGLTDRELDVLVELAAGHANQAIAARLGITEHTVKSHLVSAFSKIGCSSRVQAAIFAYDMGLVSPDATKHLRDTPR